MKNIVLLAAVLLLFSCKEEAPQLKVLQGEAFGTTYALQYYAPKTFDALKGLDSTVNAVNKSVSTYLPNSDISRINRGDSTVVVDVIFKDVYEISRTVFGQSEGYFDPTIGVLRNAYGFGDEKPLKRIDSTTLDSLRRYVGFNKVRLTETQTIEKDHSEIYFDFNAVAKGYGIDCIGNYLARNGIDHYILELGGEILTKGIHLDRQSEWTAGIEDPGSGINNRSYTQAVLLKDVAMASSGNYRKFRVDSLTGQTYVHTINPLTGKAQPTRVTSATVIAPTCAYADAYATAFMAMGVNKAKGLVKELDGVEMYLTYIDPRGAEQVFMSGGFRKYLRP